MERFGNLDARETVWFDRQLVFIDGKVAKTPREPMMGDILVPLDTDMPAGATHWAHRRITGVGMAEMISSKSDNFPYVEVEAFETLVKMHMCGLGFWYDWLELKQKALTGTDLGAERAVETRMGHDAKRNQITMLGDAKLNIPGFVNDASVPRVNALNGSWLGATPAQIVEDFGVMLGDQEDNTGRTLPATAVALPPSRYRHLVGTPMSETNSQTIMKFLREAYPQITFFQASELETAGVGATPRAVVYRRDPLVLKQKTSVICEQLAPQAQDQKVKVPCLSMLGGCHWLIPIAGLFVDEI